VHEGAGLWEDWVTGELEEVTPMVVRPVEWAVEGVSSLP
jgi:hypothetical protein